MDIPLGHDRRFMPQEPLHIVQIHSGLDHPRGTGMALQVRAIGQEHSGNNGALSIIRSTTGSSVKCQDGAWHLV
jgi:hypothetical protein